MIDFTKELQAATEKIQDECHGMINEIMADNPTFSYQDATNVFIFTKLAQQRILIDMLKEKLKSVL